MISLSFRNTRCSYEILDNVMPMMMGQRQQFFPWSLFTMLQEAAAITTFTKNDIKLILI